MSPAPRSLVGRALYAASAGLHTAATAAGATGQVLDRAVSRSNITEVARTMSVEALEVLDAADLGVGDARLTREGAERARRLAARALRQMLALPEDLPSDQRGDAAGHPGAPVFPPPDVQVRDRFRSLLDPAAPDVPRATTLLAISAQLSPDEARILRYLDEVERVPVLDVVASTRLGPRDDVVLGRNLSVVVQRAGGDHPDRGPGYIANLVRLGVCHVEDREMAGHGDYDLMTTGAGYDRMAERARDARGTRTVERRGTLALTQLGRELVEVAFHAAEWPSGGGVEPDPHDLGPPPGVLEVSRDPGTGMPPSVDPEPTAGGATALTARPHTQG